MITSEKPNVKPGCFYSLMQTAAALGVNKSTVSRWTKAGKLRAYVRDLTNRPTYQGADILSAWARIY